jgi:tripartite-type tricarboxylate transporter receptor subunit TctC
MKSRRAFLLNGAGMVACSTGIVPSFAQTWPSRTVRIVVPFGAGSLTDILARVIAEEASRKWNQQVIVENRPGLPGTVAVAHANPDGLTLLLTSNGHAAIGYINKNLGFDPVKDFNGITRVATIAMYLIVHPAVPATTVGELINLARSRPGTLNFATPGLGSGSFIAAALFKKLAGVDIVHIPYKGAPEAMAATVRGDAQIYFTPLNATDELVQAGRIRAVASLAAARMSELPDVPTFRESGFNLDHEPWYGLMAPAPLPRPILDKINRDVIGIIRSNKIQASLKSQYLTSLADAPEQFDEIIRADTAALADVFKDPINQ